MDQREEVLFTPIGTLLIPEFERGEHAIASEFYVQLLGESVRVLFLAPSNKQVGPDSIDFEAVSEVIFSSEDFPRLAWILNEIANPESQQVS